MKQQIVWNIQAAVHRAFPKCKLIALGQILWWYDKTKQHVQEAIIVIWLKPPQGTLKLNTDGSYIQGNGKAGLGGTLRDDQGDFCMAYVCYPS